MRNRVSILLSFAVRRDYRASNPCARLEQVTPPAKTPQILTPQELEICSRWFASNPRALGWFALSALAGLRPHEAQQTTWGNINTEEGWIRVEAQTSKIRQRRVVYPPKPALAWLRAARALGATLPLNTTQRFCAVRGLVEALGWPTWKQDVTRHSAATYMLATSESAAAVANTLGNSESILRRHYLALVTRPQAEAFWAVPPPAVPATASPSATSARTSPWPANTTTKGLAIPQPLY